jgi:hypothetical protein
MTVGLRKPVCGRSESHCRVAPSGWYSRGIQASCLSFSKANTDLFVAGSQDRKFDPAAHRIIGSTGGKRQRFLRTQLIFEYVDRVQAGAVNQTANITVLQLLLAFSITMHRSSLNQK